MELAADLLDIDHAEGASVSEMLASALAAPPGSQIALPALIEACNTLDAVAEEFENGEGRSYGADHRLWLDFRYKITNAEQALVAATPAPPAGGGP